MNNNLWFGRHANRVALVGAFVALTGLCGFGIARGVLADEPQNHRTATETTSSSAPLAERTAVLADLENGFSAIADRMEPSVVAIRVKKTIRTAGISPDMGDPFQQFQLPGDPQNHTPNRMRIMPNTPRQISGAGSGVIVRSDGWILTNDHVVGGVDKVTVTLHDGREFDGTVRRDFRSDLALVKINANNLTPATFADSDRVRVGQWAIAFGSPFELDDTMTVGVISARHRQNQISEEGQTRFYPSLLQTDASINPGNSGGPLVDIHGQIVGINVAINTTTGGSVGIGFAIPANTARHIMDQLISSGKVTRGYLGLQPSALTPNQRQRYGVESGGVFVESVNEDTPAWRAGLRDGDVIVRFDGKEVADDIAFRDIVANTAPGKRIEIVVHRDGRDQTLNATLDAAPDLLAQEQKSQQDSLDLLPVEPGTKVEGLGVRVEPITPDNADKFHVSSATHGVVVDDVQSGSPAEEAGIQPGFVITRANGHDIRSDADLKAALRGVKSGDTVDLSIVFNKSHAMVTVHMP